MDEIEKRLKETSEACFSLYESWLKDKKNADAREALQDSIHELRKVASRLEIELAVSDRDEMAKKPIPIPPHRDAKRRSDAGKSDDDGNTPNKGGRGRKPSAKKKGGDNDGNAASPKAADGN